MNLLWLIVVRVVSVTGYCLQVTLRCRTSSSLPLPIPLLSCIVSLDYGVLMATGTIVRIFKSLYEHWYHPCPCTIFSSGAPGNELIVDSGAAFLLLTQAFLPREASFGTTTYFSYHHPRTTLPCPVSNTQYTIHSPCSTNRSLRTAKAFALRLGIIVVIVQ